MSSSSSQQQQPHHQQMSSSSADPQAAVSNLLAAFADPTPGAFDAIDWVNAALSATAPAARSSTDTHISSLIVKLQLLSQDTTDAIEASMTHMVGALPRTERDLAQIKADAGALTDEFNAVLTQPSRSPHDSTTTRAAAKGVDVEEQEETKEPPKGDGPTGPPAYIDELEALDLIKSNMEETKDLLHEAAAWERLVREVDVVLDGTDLSRTAEHIAMLQRSAKVLGDMPGADGRRATLTSVKERFEAMVQPQLEAALTADDAGSLERLVKVFGRMGRSQFLAAEFARARVRPLRDMWREADDSPASTFPGSAALLEWTSAFYSDCLRTLTRETRRVQRLFPSKSTGLVLARLVTEVWDPASLPSARPLSPASGGMTDDLNIAKSFRRRIDAHGSFGDVVPLFHAARKFGAEVADALPSPVSQRLALAAIGVPFKWYQHQYGVLERDFLLDQLRDLNLPSTDLPTCVSALESALRDIQSAAAGAVQRCSSLTLATEIDGLLLALSAFFDEVLQHAQRLVNKLVDATSPPSPSSSSSSSSSARGGGGGGGGGGAGRAGMADGGKHSDGDDERDADGDLSPSSPAVDRFNVDSETFGLGLRVLNLSDKLMRLVLDLDEQCRSIVCHHRAVLLYGADTAKAWQAEVEAEAAAAAAAVGTDDDDDVRVSESGAGNSGGSAPSSPSGAPPASSPEPGATSPRSPPLTSMTPMRMRSPSDFRLRASSSGGGGGGFGGPDGDAVPAGHDVAMLCAQQALADTPAKADSLKSMVNECLAGSCLLPKATDGCRQFDHRVQQVLYTMMLGPVRARLDGFPDAAAWTSKSVGGDGDGGDDDDDDDDVVFSLQPLPYITAIGEHLLVTVRLLEPLARGDIRRTAQMDPDDFQRFGKDVWESVSALLSITRPYQTSDTEQQARVVIESTLAAPSRRPRRESSAGSPTLELRDGALSPSGTSASEIARSYSTLWLAAIVRGCVCLVLQRMLNVRAVSGAGARQLASDLEYLSNVLQALGFGADPVLPRFRELLLMPSPGLSSLIESSSTITASAQDFEEARLRRHVAQMRDILTTF